MGSSIPGWLVAPTAWEQHPLSAGCCSHSRRVLLGDLDQFGPVCPFSVTPGLQRGPAGPAATHRGRCGRNLFCKGRQQALAFCDGNVALQEQKANVLWVAAKTSARDI